ncbi:hypothetical protein FACS1894103_4460 [Campylobacterota bacterium]|nr:hypothetical protein FACS1894103_4460 [Campylobacterota bacterium]
MFSVQSSCLAAFGAGHEQQRYKCLQCDHQFVDSIKLDDSRLWHEYTVYKQTYTQLAEKYNYSLKTVKRHLDKYKPTNTTKVNTVVSNTPIILLIDTTYFGRKFGLMLFRDALTKVNLLHMYVQYETNALYMQGIEELERMGYVIKGVVCDGKVALIRRLSAKYPVQMCHYHQAAIVRRYLTKNPKTQAAIELKQIASLVKRTDKESLTTLLNDWHNRYKLFLNERTINPKTNRWCYTHKRLRSAYNSLKRNLPHLFTYQKHKDICIPNTTNSNEGHFSALKNMHRNHNGLSITNKMKLIDDFLRIG